MVGKLAASFVLAWSLLFWTACETHPTGSGLRDQNLDDERMACRRGLMKRLFASVRRRRDLCAASQQKIHNGNVAMPRSLVQRRNTVAVR